MPLALLLAAPLSVAIVPVAFCDEDPVATPVAVPLETLGQALAVAKGVPLREAAIERETLAEPEELLDTDGEPVTVRLTTPVRDPISLREPEMLRPVVPVPLTEAEPVTVPRPDADPLPVTDTESLTVAGLKEAEAEGDTEAEARSEAEGCGEAEPVSEGKEAVASAVPVRQTVPETEPDFVIVCVNVCVQVKYSVAVEELETRVEGVTEPLFVRDTSVLDPVLDAVPVLLTLVLGDTVAVGTTVRVLTAVAEIVAVPMLDLLGFIVPEADTEAVVVFVLEGEPLALRVRIGL